MPLGGRPGPGGLAYDVEGGPFDVLRSPWQRPAAAPHAAPRPGRQPLRRGAVRHGGLHRAQLAALPPDAADADPQDRTGQPDPPRGGGRRPPSPSIDQDRRRARERGRRDGSRAAVLQSRRRLRRRASGGIDAGWDLLSQRHRRRDAVRPRRDRRMRHGLRAASLRTGRLPRPADRNHVAAGPGRGLRATDALPRGAIGHRAAEALSQRLRPAPRARTVFAARPPCPGRGRRRGRRTATS